MSSHEIDISADELIERLLRLGGNICVLDSCGAGHLGSHLLVAGIQPVWASELSYPDPNATLSVIDRELSVPGRAVFLTLAYEFGAKLNKIPHKALNEPDVFLASFDTLVVHDYTTSKTYLTGNTAKFETHAKLLKTPAAAPESSQPIELNVNFSKEQYLNAVETVLELIRSGDTYQTNLTMQFRANSAENIDPRTVFERLRRDNPAPFAAYFNRGGSTVVSASPERFIRVSGSRIETSPIKGTRPRGRNRVEDEANRNELLTSEKDRAENTMIVDLLRNDLGRVCEFGSVRVEQLCDLEEHPTLFHLVSTVSGKLRPATKTSDILRAVFPCGSITGAPKISTMRIIEKIEPDARGLSMGAIGYSINGDSFDLDNVLDLSVAIRTMTVSGSEAVFNVGGGIVIDSGPESEYDEALLKGKALIAALAK